MKAFSLACARMSGALPLMRSACARCAAKSGEDRSPASPSGLA
jgi:hypothetical protein